MTETIAYRKLVGARIKRLRGEMTQSELASAAGTNQAHISRIERGLQGIQLDVLVKISKALGVSPDILTTFESNDERQKCACGGV